MYYVQASNLNLLLVMAVNNRRREYSRGEYIYRLSTGLIVCI